MTKKPNLYPVILAGGVGERFWPCSRASRPKQLLPLLSSKSLFAETYERALTLAPAKNIVILTRKALHGVISKAVKGKQCTIIGEPVGRNTAPAIAAAGSWIMKKDPDGVMAVLSSDHNISPVSQFTKSVNTAVQIAQQNYLVVFGIPPVRPDTGYGYVHIEKPVGKGYVVKAFCEKPDLPTAKRFFKSRKHFWNSGMFVWKASVIMEEFKRQMPAVYRLSQNLSKCWERRDQQKGINAFYNNSESQSIDYGIMENARKVAAVRATFKWDDVGSWEALWRIRKPDSKGNVFAGKTLSINNTNSLLFSDEGMVMATGLKDIIVVQSNGATMVIPRSDLGNIKKYIKMIRQKPGMVSFLE